MFVVLAKVDHAAHLGKPIEHNSAVRWIRNISDKFPINLRRLLSLPIAHYNEETTQGPF